MISQPNALGQKSIFLLCLALWLGGVIFFAIGLSLLMRGVALFGGLAAGVAVLMIAAGTGLFFLRRWGVVLFGLLALLGAVNHLATTLGRYNDINQAGAPQIFAALVSILVAILIPAALIYLTLLLWRQMR